MNKKSGNSKPGNGGAKPVTPAPTMTENIPTVQLKEEDQKIIREFDQDMLKAKIELANISAQIYSMEQQRNQMAQRLIDLDRGFFERVKKTAAEYGLDLEHQKWNFDAGKMAFSKMD